MKEFPALAVTQIKPDDCIAEYVYLPKIVHLDDSAIDALTDFHLVKPLTFNKTEQMMEARKTMQISGLHVGLVFGDNKKLIGLLSFEQILGAKTIKMIESRRIERKDILIASVMTRLEKVATINVDTLKYAKVGHVVATLKRIQQYYLLVVEKDKLSGKKMIRGVFLASVMSKLLGEHIIINPAQAKSVAELQKKLNQ